MLNTDWKREYELDLPEIDVQHIRFMNLIKKIDQSEEKKLPELVQELYRYARFHFISEEALMLINSYPRLQEHHMEHENVLQRIMEFNTKLKNGQEKKETLMFFLIQWFSKHTTGTDQHMGEFVKAGRVEAV